MVIFRKGKKMCHCVQTFDPSEKNFAQLFAFMNADTLWVPVSAHFSGPDEAKIMRMLEILINMREDGIDE